MKLKHEALVVSPPHMNSWVSLLVCSNVRHIPQWSLSSTFQLFIYTVVPLIILFPARPAVCTMLSFLLLHWEQSEQFFPCKKIKKQITKTLKHYSDFRHTQRTWIPAKIWANLGHLVHEIEIRISWGQPETHSCNTGTRYDPFLFIIIEALNHINGS